MASPARRRSLTLPDIPTRLVGLTNEQLVQLADDLDGTDTMRPLFYPTSDSVTIKYGGPVIAKERPRLAAGNRTYTPPKTVAFEATIASIGRRVMAEVGLRPYNRPIAAHLEVREAIPQSWGRSKTRLAMAGMILPEKRDLDNQIKAIFDALNGVCFVDDSQLNQIFAFRKFGLPGFALTLFPIGISVTDAINVDNILKNRGRNGIGR